MKMSENQRHGESDAVVENSATPTIRESTMKDGWCKTFNNAMYYYQMPFDIALILDQVSNYNFFTDRENEHGKSYKDETK